MEKLPLDVISPILEQLHDRRDLNHCALVSWMFNRAATPLLYRTLDARLKPTTIKGRPVVVHACRTLLSKPEYAKYVRYARETAMCSIDPYVVRDCRKVLQTCTNLRSFTWVDDAYEGTDDDIILGYVSILQTLPYFTELTIRTSSGLSDRVWNKITQLTGLRRVSIWCLHGKPRVLQGWSERLGSTLTHLELGRCAGVPATILVSVLSHLNKLKTLRLKGAPSNSIPEILSVLPNLECLDAEYFGSGTKRYNDEPVASLRELTVRTSSVDQQGPQKLWSWIAGLIPRPSLETLIMHTFSTQGEMSMPRLFLLDLARTQKHTLKYFLLNTVQLTLEDLECLCTIFPELVAISCSLAWCRNHAEIKRSIRNARKLQRLRLHVNWIPGSSFSTSRFGTREAMEWMMGENSQLRVIEMGQDVYTGRWVRREPAVREPFVEFEVACNTRDDPWI
ncbi:hypothetical protein K474DRAFT_1693547 [Panus rudis PR-1116 ss-1]|nr:hypothetical protein K474DRAFT_1693547 [Panus rudis PR-1116 ss-1]